VEGEPTPTNTKPNKGEHPTLGYPAESRRQTENDVHPCQHHGGELPESGMSG